MDTRSIVDSAFEEVARQAVRGVIAEEVGSGIQDEVKTAILEMARDMTKNDPKIQKLIRDALIYWISRSANNFESRSR